MDKRKIYNWQGYYNYQYVIDNLSISERRYLREALRAHGKVNCLHRNAKSLDKAALWDYNKTLTYEGRVVAIALSPLPTQANALSLNIIDIALPYTSSVEKAVRTYLMNSKCYTSVCYSEGGDIGTLLSCMSFEVIREAWDNFYKTDPAYKANYEEYGQSSVDRDIKSVMYSSPIGSTYLLYLMSDNPNLERQLKVAILETIATAKKSDIEKAFNLMRQWQRPFSGGKGKWPLRNWRGLYLSHM